MDSHPISTPQYREIKDTELTLEQFNKILCPNLRIGVRMGLLNPDGDGWVSSDEMQSFLNYIGAKKKSLVLKELVSVSEGATELKRENHINIVELKGTRLDHGSSSGILNNTHGFSEERLAHLKSFSDDGKCLHKKEMAAAANDFHRCPVNFKSNVGTNIQSLEISTVMEIYAQTDDQGRRFFSMDDIDCIWKHNRFPEYWKKPKKGFYGTLSALFKFFYMFSVRWRLKLFTRHEHKKHPTCH